MAIYAQRSADSSWAKASEANANSLFRRARIRSDQASIYRNAARAVPVSAPGAELGRDTLLEIRTVRARVRYAGPVVGPRPVDKEEILRLLRAPGGKWIIFSKYLVEDDPAPEMILLSPGGMLGSCVRSRLHLQATRAAFYVPSLQRFLSRFELAAGSAAAAGM